MNFVKCKCGSTIHCVKPYLPTPNGLYEYHCNDNGCRGVMFFPFKC